jgi:tetratricopeptide (TPR) repeat protein
MEIPLGGAGRRLGALLVCIATAALVIFQAGEFWLAHHWLESDDVTLMERGAALVPGDGEGWDRVGRLRQWDFVHSDLSKAIAEYQKAVQDDPRSAHYWMDLASAYEAAGDSARAQDAYARAQAVYPLSAEVAFHYGNFLLREQEYPDAYEELRQAVRADPTLLPLAISRTWRSSEDIDQLLDEVLPADADAYLQALDFFGSIHNAQPGLAVWQRLIALGKPFPLTRTFEFLDELIREDRADDARHVWLEALAGAGLPHEKPANGSLIWNGDFAGDFANGGLGWRWNPYLAGVTFGVDPHAAPDGGRALRLDFSGGSNIPLDSPFQYAAVEPNQSYRFHAYMRSQGITTESGPRFSVTDPNHAGAINVTTDNFIGSHSWTAVEADIATGPDTHFLLVRLVRSPSRLFDNKLGGTAWIADVLLIPSAASAGQASR